MSKKIIKPATNGKKIFALDVLKRILEDNSKIPCVDLGIYRPSLKHFSDRKDKKERRSPFEATEHSLAKKYIRVSRKEIFNGKIEKMIGRLFPGEAIQALSRIYIEGTMHIPMLDLEIEEKEENLDFAVNSIKALGQKHGVILRSGASYHYWGFDLLSKEEWLQLMHTSLLLDDVVDRRWVGHRMLDGFSNLRLSEKGNYGFCPYVIATL